MRRMSHSDPKTSHGSHEQSQQWRWWVTVVMIPTQMSHSGTIPGPRSGHGTGQYPGSCNQIRSTLFALGPLPALHQMRGPTKRHRAPECAPRPSGHRSGTSCAHISPRCGGRSITGNNEKKRLLLPVTWYLCPFLHISTYYWPTPKTGRQPEAGDPFSG